MILFPAIDLKDGNCVRLKKGEMDDATIFNDNPGAQAADFERQGAEWVHVVDLNGAFAGEPVNAGAVDSIIAAVNVPVQLGGGIRDHATIDSWLDRGLSRVILGTIAVRDPDLVIDACKRHPGKIAVGIDARGGMVAVEGWAETSDMEALELAKRFEGAGVAAIIYTDIDRDGMMGGVNVSSTAEMAQAVSIPVIASGGVASLQDIKDLVAADAGIHGAISGRAIYDGRLDIADALQYLKTV